jgi:alanyl aminopeptidase
MRISSLAALVAATLGACGGTARVANAPVVPIASAPPPIPPVPTLRLPSGPRPTGYVLDLRLDPGVDTFRGVVDIGLELPAGTSFLWLNAKGLVVTSAELQASGAPIPVTAHPEGDELLGFAFARPAGGAATLHVDYRGPVRPECCGLFKIQSRGDRYLVTHLESHDARRLLPCFDEPSYKVPWRVTLHVPKGLVAVSNSPIAEESDDADGFHRVAFAATRPLPSYLVALGVGPFEMVDAGRAGKNETPLRIIAPRARGAEAAYAASVFPELVGRLESYFGIPFPYAKLDDLSTPATGGSAMENAGLIISGSGGLLADKASNSNRFRDGSASVIAHETAHQWFGDLVTLAWWDDTWLNEAFATWMAQKVYAVRPELAPEARRADTRRRAMEADLFASARAIRQPIRTTDDIVNAFDDITYRKGASVIAMFERALGPDKFQKGVHDYLEAHADGNGTTADFLAAISAAAGTDVAPAFTTFLDQPGLPAIAVEPSCAGGKGRVGLAQARYLPRGSSAAPASWQVPVCVKAGGKKSATACTTLTGPAGAIDLDFCPAWVLGNAGAAGYYTTVYGGDGLARLAAAAGRLDVGEQLGLVADLRLQLVGGTLPADRALDLVGRLARTAPPDVLADLAALVDVVWDRGLVPGAQAAPFAAWVERTFGARARALGWRPKPGESPAVSRSRGKVLEIVALHGRDRALRDEARALASRWLEDRKAVDPEVTPSVLRVAAWSADEPYLARVQAALPRMMGQERQALVRSLYEFNDPDLIGRAAQLLLGDDMHFGDILPMTASALTGAARSGLIRFVRDHFDALAAKLGERWALVLFDSGRSLCDAESLSQYQQYFADRAVRVAGGPRRYAMVVERVELCMAARKASEAPMTAFFKGK